MSLINEALKKAQKQRTGESPPLGSMPTIGGEVPARIARRDKPAGFHALLLRLGLGLGALLVILILGILWLRSPRTATAPTPAPAVVATTPAAAPAPAPASAPKPSPEPPGPAAAPTQFVLTIPTAAPEPAKAAPAAPAPAKTVAAAAPAPAVSSEAVAPSTPAAPLKFELKAITFVETLRVTGIRASATDSKVLMNDRVYRPGDIVEHALGIKLVGITASTLTFEDERGAKYTRNF